MDQVRAREKFFSVYRNKSMEKSSIGNWRHRLNMSYFPVSRIENLFKYKKSTWMCDRVHGKIT